MPTLKESLDALIKGNIPYFALSKQSGNRLRLLQSWLEIAEENAYDLDSKIIGKQTLDIGCGQGDMIDAFAALLKTHGDKNSKAIGVDPASLDYGSPWTLGEAQASLVSGPKGEYMTFKQTTAPELVASQPLGTYEVAYFALSLYYFPSTATLIQTFKALLDAGVRSLLLAEWSLEISRPAALTHLLAVLLQSIDPLPAGNVRTVLSPAAYIDAAKQAGWVLVGSKTFTPEQGLEDGRWETQIARDIITDKRNKAPVLQPLEERSVKGIHFESLKAHADALEASISSKAGLKGIESMDIWTAVFQPAKQVEDT